MKKSILQTVIALTVLFIFTSALSAGEVNSGLPKGARIYQTSKSGDQIKDKGTISYTNAIEDNSLVQFILDPAKTYQSIVGFGFAFTESSAYLYSSLSDEKKKEVINAFFSTNGAGCTLMRTHIGGCDFSLSSYSYDTNEGDTGLKHFTIDHDKKWLIPMIKDAMAAPGADFKLFASPWSPPAWMKNNKSYVDGTLLPEYYPAYANYFLKYIRAYQKEGIPLWGLTLQNEVQHGGQWDSCRWLPNEQLDFIKNNIGPLLAKNKLDLKIMIYDHNKDNMFEWAYTIYNDKDAAKYVWGEAFHWYDTFFAVGKKGTPHYHFENLEMVHNNFPDKHLLHTEGCVKPAMTNGAYWENQARDWTGYIYTAAHRYGIDIIGDLNNWAEGWVEWNLLLNLEGRPNHANNYDSAPIIMDEGTKTLYYNASYYILAQFSKFIRPGAVRIGLDVTTNQNSPAAVFATAFKNKDGKIVLTIFNTNENSYRYQIKSGKSAIRYQIDPNALQTVVLE